MYQFGRGRPPRFNPVTYPTHAPVRTPQALRKHDGTPPQARQKCTPVPAWYARHASKKRAAEK